MTVTHVVFLNEPGKKGQRTNAKILRVPEDLMDYWGSTCWSVSVHGILDRQLKWDDATAIRWAADCAEHVLEVYETWKPGDTRPRKAIEAARKYADSLVRKLEAEAAWAAEAAEAAGAAGAAEREWQKKKLMEYLTSNTESELIKPPPPYWIEL